MTNALDSATRPTRPTPRRRRTAGHIVAIVMGCFLLLPGFGVLVAGGSVGLAQAVATDDDGYFNVTLDRLESDGVAVAATDIWLDEVDGDAAPWVLDWLDLDLRLRVDGAATTDEVFVGIARSRDVERYLSTSAHSTIVEIDDHTPRYREDGGTLTIGRPADQDFWVESTAGAGEQQLDWEARGGRWSVVVMNADGSPAVDADVEVGARSGAVTPVAITLSVIGGLVALTAVLLIVIGVRGRRSSDGTGGSGNATGAPLPPPAPDTAVQLDEDDRSMSTVV